MSDFCDSDCFASLVGLAVGDAFGQQYVWHVEDIVHRREDVPIWRWTDDTEMALSVVSVLCDQGEIDSDLLSSRFGEHWDSGRGYGPAMLYDLLPKLQHGADWRVAAPSLFDGRGSYGNGGAMRVAPLGAHFANDLKVVSRQARLSAEVTHANAEGIAGAEAIALAATIARQQRERRTIRGPRTFLRAVLDHLPPSEVRRWTQIAHDEFGPSASREALFLRVGNGSRVTAMDTVPF